METVIERIKSGIPGLDELISGGIPKYSTILLSGTPGSGKTIFSLQFLVNGALKGEKGVYISLEEDVERLKDYMQKLFGWPLEELEKQNKLILVKSDIYEFDRFKRLIETNVEKIKAQRVVIDPITVISLFFEKPLEIRRSLIQLDSLLKKLKCTSILTCEIPEGSRMISSFGIEEFISDGIILLSYVTGKHPRRIVIRKMRASMHDTEVHPFEIREGKGIIVYHLERIFE